MFHLHLWLGIATTAMVLILSITGVALNHKRGLGLMPDVAHEPSAGFEDSLPLATLAEAGRTAAGVEIAAAGIDRMDVRPDDGYVKVRFSDPATTEVTVDLHTATVLEAGGRGDVFLEKLHSGEIFGVRGCS